MKKLYYLAHPYTGAHEKNVREVNKIANLLIDKGYIIYSPITMSYPLHLLSPREAEFWYQYDIEILARCDGLILAGEWENSKGCIKELEFAEAMNLEIKHINELLYNEI